MIYKHIRTGDLYRVIILSFSVERQKPTVVYMSLTTGAMFDRNKENFDQNFEFVSDPQAAIVPK